MNSSTTPHTPLESLLLFRGIALHGLDGPAFARISEQLQNNSLIRNGPTYDARRLSPESLQELFLQLLRQELKTEGAGTPGPDGSLSPTSKKRKLQLCPLLTLRDARQHVEKIELAYQKLQDAYVRHAVNEIRQLEHRYDVLRGEIHELEKSGVTVDVDNEPGPQSPNSVPGAAKNYDAELANGVGTSPKASPRPAPQTQIPPPPPQQPLRPLQPLLPHPTPRQDARNGLTLPPQPPSAKAAPAPRSPALSYPEAVRGPQLSPQEFSKPPSGRHVATSMLPNGTHQVLQAPQGVPSFQPPPTSPAPPATSEGLRRPESVALPPRQPPVSQPTNAQLPPQGQLKWEPPYQPNTPAPRQTAVNVLPPPPHPLPAQRPPPQPPRHPSPLASQGQAGRTLPQQALIPPHATAQFAPALQSPPVRPPPDSGSGPAPNKQQPPVSPGASNIPQPQSLYPPAPYPGYPIRNPPHPVPVNAVQGVQVGEAQPVPAVHPGRSPAVPASPAPAAALPLPQPPNLQAPPPYIQPPGPQPIPSQVPTHPDASRRYSSPYQPPRPAAVERIHPRPPAAATPTQPARFSPAPSAPQTPAMALPLRSGLGSGTKWLSTSTPSTPKPGVEFRLGYDDVPSPAFEPTSPVLQPAAPAATMLQGEPKETVRRPEVATKTPVPKRRPGRPSASQRAEAGVPLSQPAVPPPATQLAGPQAKQVSQAASEPEPLKVKVEVTTPRPPTENGDTTADESVAGRARPPRPTKRKREDLTPTPVQTLAEGRIRDALPEGLPQPDGPKVVLWTRSFNKVCQSAMEQIVHHRDASMFAAPIREKDAPGYRKVVKFPQDLKGIRAAISHGNRAAIQAAAALPDGDPGTSSVWLPRTEELVPPRSIINSSQLDRELAHMFANAVMYNPDPHHGPGPAFLRGDVADDDNGGGGGPDDGPGSGSGALDGGGGGSGVLGYQVDEFGVVNDARAMFVEVEKLLSELRSAEVRRAVPPPAYDDAAAAAAAAAATGTSTRQASVQPQREESVKQEAGDVADGEEEEEEEEQGEEREREQTGTETEAVGGTAKRRRVARG